jgi:hypothetical protein
VIYNPVEEIPAPDPFSAGIDLMGLYPADAVAAASTATFPTTEDGWAKLDD